MNMVRIEPGSFMMGSEGGDWDERPVRKVTISQPFFMSTTEVTNAQYEQFDPRHKQYRGKLGFSKADGEAVFRRPYRPGGLPSKAGWRYDGTGVVETEAVEVLPEGGIHITTGANQRVRWVGDRKHSFAAKAGTAHTAEITMRVLRSTSSKRGIGKERLRICPPADCRHKRAAALPGSHLKTV
jgi:hypothetical protein